MLASTRLLSFDLKNRPSLPLAEAVKSCSRSLTLDLGSPERVTSSRANLSSSLICIVGASLSAMFLNAPFQWKRGEEAATLQLQRVRDGCSPAPPARIGVSAVSRSSPTNLTWHAVGLPPPSARSTRQPRRESSGLPPKAHGAEWATTLTKGGRVHERPFRALIH